ncbi:MAG TPA: hypothetical protein EYP61_08065 [Candidatus Latescibacteria bacterium]|nr:hypothetical protein [Candidatus Latescibacterota bacterium]
MEGRRAFTVRAFLVGLALSLFLSIACPYTVLMLHTAGMSADFITAGAVFLFFLLTGANGIVRKLKRGWALSTPELIVVYIMMIVASAIPTWGLVANLLPVMTGAFYYATPENGWKDLIWPYIPNWLVPDDLEAIKHFYEALPEGAPIPWGVWVRPLLAWGSFVLSIYFVMACMMVIMRKQWIEHERLVFPLTQLPLEMVREEGALFGSKLMWTGFALAFVLPSFLGLHHYFHFVPPVQMQRVFYIFRRTTRLRIFLNFPVLGFTYFINTNVAFSLWFFHILSRVQTGTFNVMGFSLKGHNEVFTGSSPSVSHQGMGAMIVLVAFGLWTARRHIGAVLRKAFGGRSELDDSHEMLPYRTAVWGAILGLCFIALWLRASGMSFKVVFMFMLGAFVVFLGLARIIAEGGVGFCRAQMVPPPFVVYGLGTEALGTSTLVSLGFTYAWSTDIRTTVMVSTINGFKLADTLRVHKRSLVWAIFPAILVAMLGSIWVTLKLAYTYGGINLQSWFFGGLPRTAFGFVADKLRNPVTPDMVFQRWLFTGIGAGVMGLLMFARHRFVWWPLHYLGFPIGDTWVMEWVWFSIMLGWLVKVLILKYGGIRLYRNLKPLFLGLILGQISCAGIWMIIDFITGTSGNYIYIGVP